MGSEFPVMNCHKSLHELQHNTERYCCHHTHGSDDDYIILMSIISVRSW